MVFNSRLRMILTTEELNRIRIMENNSGLHVVVNVHGLKCCQARRLLNNIINVAKTSFLLTIIHGYNHGTAIKEMLATNFDNFHIHNRFTDYRNPGVTYMQIAAY